MEAGMDRVYEQIHGRDRRTAGNGRPPAALVALNPNMGKVLPLIGEPPTGSPAR
jgi:hypothetical protein